MGDLLLYIKEARLLAEMLDLGEVRWRHEKKKDNWYDEIRVGDYWFIFEHKRLEFKALYIRKFNVGNEYETIKVERNEQKLLEAMHESLA